ncbi:MAG TPA: hypothetical protein DCP75_10760 [Haliea salexigens]|uniref:PasA protein n=1 Tax=Haliea salexigens TaxID=287487 RepID=A0A3C1KN91_9GAMM|nr:hypothetical protein [Haliea salexigens]
MSSLRGQANHALYLGRILLQSWEQAQGAESLPAHLLAQAFGPAVRQHLLRAYGWFLLDLQKPAQLPAEPPACVAALPPTAPGKAQPAELTEFAQLEADGWLAPLLQEPGTETPRRSEGSLAATASGLPDRTELQSIADRLDAAFSRMGDLLDEC